MRENVTLIYDTVDEEALRIMRQEFLDHIIRHAIIEPLVRQINMQKEHIESLIYEKRELVVKLLTNLLEQTYS